MIVCIAEKPSVAKDIARIIGANQSKDGYMEGNGFQVTWTFGHLCELKMPEDYAPQWKSWRQEYLPMIPPRFGIRLKDDKGVKKQFDVIQRLMSKAERIINCGDAGQEGELIQRWVMQKAGAKCPVSRLWISSMTDEAIREGFENLKDQQEYHQLYMAGLSRAIGDWLLGINATRLYTIKYGQPGHLLSIGRVQTPTLALIVKRQQEIEQFKPEPYWVLSTIYRDTTFTATKGRFTNKEEGEKSFELIKDKPFEITKVEKKNGKEAPPHLYDLTSLQVDCNRKFGMSAEVTLNTIQALYERKLTTYPRVDTQFLSEDVYAKCPAILNGLYQAKFAGEAPYAVFIKPLGLVLRPYRRKPRRLAVGVRLRDRDEEVAPAHRHCGRVRIEHRGGDRREERTHENAENADNDEQLDERKAFSCLFHFFLPFVLVVELGILSHKFSFLSSALLR